MNNAIILQRTLEKIAQHKNPISFFVNAYYDKYFLITYTTITWQLFPPPFVSFYCGSKIRCPFNNAAMIQTLLSHYYQTKVYILGKNRNKFTKLSCKSYLRFRLVCIIIILSDKNERSFAIIFNTVLSGSVNYRLVVVVVLFLLGCLEALWFG